MMKLKHINSKIILAMSGFQQQNHQRYWLYANVT